MNVIGQMHGTARLMEAMRDVAHLMLEALQIDAERRVVLLDRAGEHHAPRGEVRAHDREPMRRGESFDALHVDGGSAEAAFEFFARNRLRRPYGVAAAPDCFGFA